MMFKTATSAYMYLYMYVKFVFHLEMNIKIWSSSGVVVKLLTCGARGPGVWFLVSPLRFQRLIISCFQVAIWLKYH